MLVIKRAPAMRVVFFYPGEEGTYVDNADVTLYENGIVHIVSNQEETTTHLQNCEILWRFEVESDERSNKVRLLKPKTTEKPVDKTGDKDAGKPSVAPSDSLSIQPALASTAKVPSKSTIKAIKGEKKRSLDDLVPSEQVVTTTQSPSELDSQGPYAPGTHDSEGSQPLSVISPDPTR